MDGPHTQAPLLDDIGPADTTIRIPASAAPDFASFDLLYLEAGTGENGEIVAVSSRDETTGTFTVSRGQSGGSDAGTWYSHATTVHGYVSPSAGGSGGSPFLVDDGGTPKVAPTVSATGGVAIGVGAEAAGYYAQAVSYYGKAYGKGSFATGFSTKAYGYYSHVEGKYSQTASGGVSAHAEGVSTQVSGEGAHAEGDSTTASGAASHAEGYASKATYSGAHAEGYQSYAYAEYAHAEGYKGHAYGFASHSEGYRTQASGKGAHARGTGSKAKGDYSTAAGYGGVAAYKGAYARGGSFLNNGSMAQAVYQSFGAYTAGGVSAYVNEGLPAGPYNAGPPHAVSALAFKGMIVGYGGGYVGSWEFSGLATNASGSLALVDSTVNQLHYNGSADTWSVALYAYNAAIVPKVTGPAGYSVFWAGYIKGANLYGYGNSPA